MLCAAGLLGFPVLARQVTAQNDWVQDSDYALLHAKASGQDLECRLTRIAPFLGIDLLYHAGFEVHVPRRQFRADGVLRITTEITPARPRGAPRYFVQDLSVQPAGGEADGGALFSLGEGEYRVNWLMRGRGGRFRTAHWSFRVGSSRYGAKVETAMHPGHIEVAGIDPFSQPPEVKGGHLGRLKVAVFVNVAPPDPSAAALSTRDRFALGSMLKVIERDARIGQLSVVAFDLPQGRVIYRQRESENVNLPALGKAMRAQPPGTVDAARLGEKNAEAEFLAQLLAQEIDASDPPDALIFAGPRAVEPPHVSLDCLNVLGSPAYPIFYLDYNANPTADPWSDAIGDVVRFFQGREYVISKPLDLWEAWKNILDRTAGAARAKDGGRRVAAAARQDVTARSR